MNLSIIIPAKNEADNLASLLPKIRSLYPDAELIVVDDGSSDGTGDVARENGAVCIRHHYSLGNGAAIKSGARLAKGKVLVFLDGDGQHNPDDIKKLLDRKNDGFDMVIGARDNKSQASFSRLLANKLYNKFASLMTGRTILDLTSGFRVVDAKKFKRFLYLLPNGFSYPTTITMAFFRSGFQVDYVSITTLPRAGNSKISIFRDGIRFLIIIMKIGALFSPMRLFLPISALLFVIGSFYYGYTYYTSGRFTNMSAVIYLSSLTIFMMGVVSEQISSLLYRTIQEDDPGDE
ncbi:MAG: glycosyltransferase family 2 protein [Acidiferrobacterales bacterium]